ncbi:MAG TPA: phage holin family protein [Acidimicrobiales bacterium]|nr:phage holin family protein [Acidimicrobiales bacterium]
MPDGSITTRRDQGAQINEAVELVKAYARQETIEPLKNTGRFLGFGVAGAVLLGIGMIFLLLAVLRVLQTETDAFDGTWSFVPYLIVFVVAVAIVALAVSRVQRGSLDRRSHM